MTINELRQLALHAVKGTAPAEFTVENVNDAFVDGLKEFVKHNGKMRLLCGTELNSEDEYAILNASEIANELSDNFLQELEFISDDVQMNRIKLLAWIQLNIPKFHRLEQTNL